MIFKIATRNLIKNFRRSAATLLAVCIGGVAALLFGGFVTSIWYGVQTSMVQDQGNLQVHRKGWLEFGPADPDAYLIENWPEVVALLRGDAELERDLTIVTPKLVLGGIAGDVDSGASKTFIGLGVIPSEADRMRAWDAWGLGQRALPTGLSDDDTTGVVLGRGMARMMGMCETLSVPDCQDPPKAAAPQDGEPGDFDALIASEADLSRAADPGSDPRPALNLLAATSTGAPNITRVRVEGAQSQAQRAVDNAFVLMHFDQARGLLYRDQPFASALMIQISDPARIDAVKARIQTLLDGAGFDLEALKMTEVDSTFDRVFGMFSFMFAVVSAVLALVIVFTILNTVSMTVVERTREIGTIRAFGFRRGFVQRLFLAESAVIGAVGAALALVVAGVISMMVNRSGIQWTPPSNATPITIQLMVFDNPVLTLSILAALVLIAIAASLLPTRRAARMSIVSALHHA